MRRSHPSYRGLTLSAGIFFMLLLLMWGGKSLAADDLFLNLQPSESLPPFALPLLGTEGGTFSNKDLPAGKVSLLNVWASWCGYCNAEHPLLLEMQKKYNIPIYGIDLSDNSHAALGYLSRHGNPYVMVGQDESGTLANALQVSGTPETFILDKHNVIRYRRIGMIDKAVLENILLPLIKEYQKEN